MAKEGFFAKLSGLKDRFKQFFQHRKQVAALDNYTFLKTFGANESQIFSSIKFCLKNDFLENEDADWLTIKLDKLNLNYLDWCQRTKWVKQQIARKEERVAKSKPIQTCFEFQEKLPVQIPLEILNMPQKRPYMRVP